MPHTRFKPVITQAPPPEHPKFRPRIVLKFRDDVDVPTISGLDAALRAALAAASPSGVAQGAKLQPAQDGASLARIRLLVATALRRDPTYRPPRFENYYRLAVPPGGDATRIIAALAGLPWIERAWLERTPLPPPNVAPSGDDEFPGQTYLGPDGVNAEYAWELDCGDGTGQTLVDIEQGWQERHEDLKEHGITVGGDSTEHLDHGTAVLGIAVARDNEVGCVGVAPAVASVRCESEWRTSTEYATKDAIQAAIEGMNHGHVLLLEAQTYASVGADTLWYVPVEVDEEIYERIRLATALGIVVIEAAGDGYHALETIVDGSGGHVLDRSRTTEFRDSGAILVGAASKSRPYKSLGESCHGNRVDCFAWGEGVTTLTTDGAGADLTDYRDDFGGTSAAAAIVAGVALVVQGLAEKHLGWRLDSWRMRVLLSDPAHGAVLDDGETEALGVMPDLKKLLEADALALAPDVYVRDFVGDVGDVHDALISASPDVIVTTTDVADPQDEWGEGSGTEDSDSLGGPVTAGRDHHVHVRVRNRGGTSVEDLAVTVYWAEPSLLLTPDAWTRIGSTTIAKVPVGDVLTVSDGILWPAADVPGAGRYCFVATIGHALDPEPLPAATFTWDQYRAWIRRNNNVAWRNFEVVSDPAAFDSGMVAFALEMRGAPDLDLPFGLEIVGRMPPGSRVLLEMPEGMLERLGLTPLPVKWSDEMPTAGRVRIGIHPWSRTNLGEIRLPRRQRLPLRLLLWIPQGARHRRASLHVRQTHEGRAVGGFTWRFDPPRKD